MREEGDPLGDRHFGRIPRGGAQGGRARTATQGHLRRIRHGPDRAELPGRDQHGSQGPTERLVRPQDAGGRADRLLEPIGRALHGRARLRPRKADRILQVRQLRQQGGGDGDRAFRLSAPRSADEGDFVVLGGVARRAGIDRGGPPRDPRRRGQADPGDQVGPHAARRRRGRQPYRLAGRRGLRLRRRVPRGGHHPRGQHRGDVQRGRLLHVSTPAGRQPPGDCHQRRRAGRDGHRCGHPLRAVGAAAGAAKPWRRCATHCPPRPT